jgi:hypothetical protein
MFEKSPTVVRFIVVTFVLIFNEVANMLAVVKELVKMAFPRVYKLARVPPIIPVEKTSDVVVRLALLMFVTHMFCVVMALLANRFPPTKRVEGGATVVPIPRFCAYDTIERVPAFIEAALMDWAVTELLV